MPDPAVGATRNDRGRTRLGIAVEAHAAFKNV